jgi:YHS domain-containing protein
MFRLFLLAIIVYFSLRLVRRIVAAVAPRPNDTRPRQDYSSSQTKAGPAAVIDEMRRCPVCGTYNPTRLAYRKKELYFCNERCHEDFIRREQAS